MCVRACVCVCVCVRVRVHVRVHVAWCVCVCVHKHGFVQVCQFAHISNDTKLEICMTCKYVNCPLHCFNFLFWVEIIQTYLNITFQHKPYLKYVWLVQCSSVCNNKQTMIRRILITRTKYVCGFL